jgi:hypothetical protein
MFNKKEKKAKKLYKFLDEGLKSRHGNCTWKVGEWKHEDKINICGSGFHASKTPLQAIGYVAGIILAEVEVKGESMLEDDKECWSDMRIKKAYQWTKEDSVAFAVYGAELVIENFEKVYPSDKRPREAIEAAKAYIKNPTEENREKGSAAWSAASAAWSAASAAESAASAAESAAESALRKKLDKWFITRIKHLKTYEN